MAENILIQKYFDDKGNYKWVHFPLEKNMQFKLLRNGSQCQCVWSEFDAYACIRDSKRGKHYAAWTRCKDGAVTLWMRWPYENVILKWGDYPDLDSLKNRVDGQFCAEFDNGLAWLSYHTFALINEIPPIIM